MGISLEPVLYGHTPYMWRRAPWMSGVFSRRLAQRANDQLLGLCVEEAVVCMNETVSTQP